MHWTIESVQRDNFRDRIREKVVRGATARIYYYIILSDASRIMSEIWFDKLNQCNRLINADAVESLRNSIVVYENKIKMQPARFHVV